MNPITLRIRLLNILLVVRVALLMGVAAGVIGCKAMREDAKHQHTDDHDDHHDHDEEGEAPHDEDENLLRVDRSMLRDLRVTVQAAESRPAGDAVTALGELRINEDAYAEIGTSISARVARVMVSPGDTVTVGQALVVLESPDVGQARAALLTAQARLDLAQQTLERRRTLAADQIVPQREIQLAQADWTQADAEHRAARVALSALGASRGSDARFMLTAPIAGTVIDRMALRGRMVDAQQPLFIVGNLRRLWLIVHAFERDALRMRTGTTARVTFPALPGQPSNGSVTRIGSRVDPASRTIDVRIEIDNPTGMLRPGMSASALVPLGHSAETVVAVPVQALQRLAQGWCVFLPKAQDPGLFEIRAVGRGRDLGGEVEVLSGLRAKERVVVNGAFLLKAEADKARGGGETEHHH